jgi:CRP-like cAMP-binding protein
LDATRNLPQSDLDKLSRLKALSRLSLAELKSLAGTLAFADYKRSQVILAERALAIGANILVKGIARLTFQNARRSRTTLALLAPGPIPEFPSLPDRPLDFRCEAFSDCRVGSLNWSKLEEIATGLRSVFETFHESEMKFWYRVMLRNSSLLNLDLHQRLAVTLIELASDFGIKDARGMLLEASFHQRDIADLVGASRPRVSEHLAELEREKLLIRQGRQLIVCIDRMKNSIQSSPVGRVS